MNISDKDLYNSALKIIDENVKEAFEENISIDGSGRSEKGIEVYEIKISKNSQDSGDEYKNRLIRIIDAVLENKNFANSQYMFINTEEYLFVLIGENVHRKVSKARGQI